MSIAALQHSRPKKIVAYLSGHGYGHYTRSVAVLSALSERVPVEIHLATSSQALQLARRRGRLFSSIREVDVGPGVVQLGPLAVDIPATHAALQQHLLDWERVVESEARFLREIGADLVYADIPPIALAAAARAGVPSVAMSNFSWSWIYAGYQADDPWFTEAAVKIAEAETLATLLLGLEMGGGLAHFPRAVCIPPVALPLRQTRSETRRALDLQDEPRKLVLLSFGGFSGELDLGHALAQNPALYVLVVGGPPSLRLENARSIAPEEPSSSLRGDSGSDDKAPRHPDLVAAVDCVIGKPGYGTVAECLSTRTPFVHVPRGAFREAPALVAAIDRYLPSALLPLPAFLAGRWSEAVDRAITKIPPEAAPVVAGVARAVAELTALLSPD